MRWSLFGLVVRCEVTRPAWIPVATAAQVDVVVRIATPTVPPADPTEAGHIVTPAHAFLTYPEIADLSVADGNDVRLAPAPGVDVRLLHQLIVGPAMALVLQQRGALVLHASAVRSPRGALLFMGSSGWGKSTTAARLYFAGRPCVADDVAPVSLRGGHVRVDPAYPAFKLWPDAARRQGLRVEDLPTIGPDEEKRWVEASEGWDPDPLPIARVYVLSAGPEISVRRGPAAESFLDVVRHTYLAKFLEPAGVQTLHFEQVASLMASVPVRTLIQGGSDGLDLLDGVVQQDLDS
jgi:hypothetical protein